MRQKVTILMAFVFMWGLLGITTTQAQWLDNMTGPGDYNLNQNGEVGTSGYNSYERFKSSDDTYLFGYAAADDIYRKSWGDQTFSQIYVKGTSSHDSKYLKGFNVVFYEDKTDYMSLMPGDTAMSFLNHQNYIYDDATGDVVLYFDTDIVLTKGVYYWMSVQAVSDYSNTAEKFDWRWDYLADVSNQKYQKPYKRGSYSMTNIPDKDWMYANSWGNANFAYSMHTSYASDLAVKMVSPTTVDLTTDAAEIGVKVYNLGTTPQKDFTITYAINGGDPVSQLISDELAPLEFTNFAFTTTADMSAAGAYNFVLTVNVEGDLNTKNNTSTTTVSNHGLVHNIMELNGLSTIACEGRFSDPGGIGEDIKDGTEYTTTLLPSSADKRVSLDFTYQYYGNLYVYDGEDITAPELFYSNGSIVDDTVTVTATNGTGALTVVWKGSNYSTYGFAADVACVTPPVKDLAIFDVISPISLLSITNDEEVTIVVKNYGSEAHTDVAVSYTLDDATAVAGTIASIGAGDTAHYTFATNVDLSAAKKYNFTVNVELANDENPDNNMLTQELINYGDVHRIAAQGTIDTVQVCSGVVTDDGGLENISSTGNLGYQITVFEPGDENSRLQIEIDRAKDSRLFIYDILGDIKNWDPNENFGDDRNKLIAYGANNVTPEGILTPANPEGKILVAWSIPYGFSFPRPQADFEAPISCVPILDNDLMAAYFEVETKMFYQNEDVIINAVVSNIGKNTATGYAVLAVDGVAVDSVATNMAVDSVMPIEFTWTPEVAGKYIVEISVIADDNANNNSTSMEMIINHPRSLATSFEWLDESRSQYDLPENWLLTSGNNGRRSIDSRGHGEMAADMPYNDTLLTPSLTIKDGDMVDFLLIGTDYMGGAGALALGYYNNETMTYTDFDFTHAEVLGNQVINVSFDISEAAGENISLAFSGTLVRLDHVTGPALYVPGFDLEVLSIDANTIAVAGAESTYDVEIRSLSEELVMGDAYTVGLYKVGDDMALASVAGVDIDLNIPTVISVNYTHGMVGAHEVYAMINYDADDMVENNMSAILPVTVLEATAIIADMGHDTDQSNSNFPVSTGRIYSISEALIPADSISQTGAITGISIPRGEKYYNAVDSIMMEVYLNHTDEVNLGKGWIMADKLVKVFDGYVSLKENQKELYVPFDNAFAYTGGNVAVMFNNTTLEGSATTQFKYSNATDTLLLTDYYNNGSSDVAFDPTDTIDGDNYYTFSKTFVASTFYFEETSGVISAVVKDGAGAVLENAVAELVVNGSTIYSTTTDNTGAASFANVGLTTYDAVFSLMGYETVSVEVTATAAAIDLGDMVIHAISSPSGLATVVDNAAKTATTTWTAAKSFAHYNVYLDGEMVMDSVEATSYMFADVTDGMHVAGVASIYNGGMSEMILDTFYVVYAPMNLSAKLYSGENTARATWEFEGTSDDFYAYEVSLNGAVIDTVMTEEFEFANLVAGENTISVVSMYTMGGKSAVATTSATIAVAPTSLMVTPDAGAHTAVATWVGTADSYNVYLNGEMMANVTDATYTLTDLTDGYFVVGVSALFGTVESDMTSSYFVFVNVSDVSALDLAIYPNPASNWIMVSGIANSVVEIRDIAGKLLVTQEMISGNERIDVSNLNNGIYVVSMKNDNGLVSKRLIIE